RQALVLLVHAAARRGESPGWPDDALGAGAPALGAAALPAPAPVARPLGADRPGLDHGQRRVLHACRIRWAWVEVQDLVAPGRHVQPGARCPLADLAGS